jgi:hypothetical protein
MMNERLKSLLHKTDAIQRAPSFSSYTIRTYPYKQVIYARVDHSVIPQNQQRGGNKR